ncbi:pep-cterm sorting domain-containing protein [Anaeramoeba flamelloides]|uniref:Pep-cterm sorting domain-containing protein n=1 Tax=Anaeramoeba flamelloides TaxID=1746091 RepID=A0ABQ8XV52_9EUKA|nr:pep-cterm sorting domain-containing protein [Anaeramoeba flamelloides]
MKRYNSTDKIKKLYNNERFCDAIFIVGKERKIFRCHKTILSMFSDFFSKLFFFEGWEKNQVSPVSEIEINDIESSCFEIVLKFIYQGEIDLEMPKETLSKVLKLSTKLQIRELQKEMMSVLLKDKDNFHLIKDFRVFDKSVLKEILTNKNIPMEPIQIFKKVFNYGEFFTEKKNLKPTITNIKNEIQDLFPFIPFEKMTTSQIQSISKQEIVPYKILFNACLKKLLLFENSSSQSTNSNETKNQNVNNQNDFNLDNHTSSNQKPTVHPNKENSKTNTTTTTSIITNQKENDLKKNNSSMDIELASNTNTNTNTNNKDNTNTNNKDKSLNKTINKKISVLLMISVRSESPVKNILNSFKQNKNLDVKHVNISENSTSDVDFEMISKHDVIFFFSNSTIKNNDKIGNMLAKFVENGGGLVVCSCAALTIDLNGHLTGRIIDEHFLPMSQGEFLENKRLKLGKVAMPEHPIMENVKQFDGGNSSFHVSAKLNNLPNGSTAIAFWEDGNVLISEQQKNPNFGKIVVLNIFPVSGKTKFWNLKTDGATIMCNSVEYVSKK